MPGRKIPLVTNYFYHVYNQGVGRQPTFTNKREYRRALQTINFYQHLHPPVKLSFLLKLNQKRQKEILDPLEKANQRLVSILAYCLMPNHFHLILQQLAKDGISKFMSNFQNSYTRYFNTNHKRKGPIFLNQFKAVLIETEDQLVHLARYIHLNPYSSYLIKSLPQIKTYPWSSLGEYLNQNSGFAICQKNLLTAQFKTAKEHWDFISSRAKYQRELETIKHLTLEDQPINS